MTVEDVYVPGEDNDQLQSDHNDQLQMEHSQGGKMAYDNTPKDNAVTIFLNEGPKKSEKSPDFGGKGLIRGEETRIAGWRNITKDGRKTINLRFRDPDGEEATTVKKEVEKEEPDDDWF